MQSVDVCTLYLNKNFVYAKNELKYTIFECPFVLNYFQVDGPLQKIKKMSNCFLSMTCLPMDIQLWPIIKAWKSGFNWWKWKCSRKHYIDISRWGWVYVMREVLLEATKVTFDANAFISMTTNESTTINNTHWLWIHLYMVQGWKIVTILLCVEILRVFVTFDNSFF